MRARVVVLLVVATIAGLLPYAVADEGVGSRPSEKRCVGDPPRQTEDPMSPTCVPSFDGDNGGSVAPGVEDDAFRVVVYVDVGTYDAEATYQAGTLVDLTRPSQPACRKGFLTGVAQPDSCDHLLVRIGRGYTRYFASRFQTYGRRPQVFMYFSGAQLPIEREFDAETIVDLVDPFAVVDDAWFAGANDRFAREMAERGVMVLSSPVRLLPETLAAAGDRVFTFDAGLRRRAALYADYVCTKVAPFPVSHTDDPSMVGRPRTFGLYAADDAGRPDLSRFADLVEEELARCGVTPRITVHVPTSGYAFHVQDPGVSGARAAAAFRLDEVTTVLWVAGMDTALSRGAAAIGYHPEIVVAGDDVVDAHASGRVQDQTVWRNAWAVHHPLRVPVPEDTIAYGALTEGAPSLPHGDRLYGIPMYRDHFMVYVAVQLAGPELTPGNVAAALRALPGGSSGDPFAASFSYPPGEHTGVDDAAEVWWDPTGVPPQSSSAVAPAAGCWRMVRGGVRSGYDGWRPGDEVFGDAGDPCTGHTAPITVSVDTGL